MRETERERIPTLSSWVYKIQRAEFPLVQFVEFPYYLSLQNYPTSTVSDCAKFPYSIVCLVFILSSLAGSAEFLAGFTVFPVTLGFAEFLS
jgi:hypothetical protein